MAASSPRRRALAPRLERCTAWRTAFVTCSGRREERRSRAALTGPDRDRAVHQAIVLAVKALNGGLFVVAFALVGEVLEPKRFAGLFSAAPSVALANLSVTIIDKGPGDARQNAIGMLVGA